MRVRIDEKLKDRKTERQKDRKTESRTISCTAGLTPQKKQSRNLSVTGTSSRRKGATTCMLTAISALITFK